MMRTEPKSLQEVHEIRAKMWEELKNYTPEQRSELINKRGSEIAEKYGFKVANKVKS